MTGVTASRLRSVKVSVAFRTLGVCTSLAAADIGRTMQIHACWRAYVHVNARVLIDILNICWKLVVPAPPEVPPAAAFAASAADSGRNMPVNTSL